MPLLEDTQVLELIPLFGDETEEAIRARWEAWANEGLTADDVDEWVDTRPPGFWYMATAPGIREFARAYDLYGTEFLAAGIPVLSWGSYLDRHAESYGLERLAATPATGEVTFYGDVGTAIGAGLVVTVADADTEGREYEVTEAGEIEAQLGAVANVAATPSVASGTLPNGTYYYVVTALNAEGETVASAPDSSTVSGGPGRSDLTWDAKAGASGYRIYRGTASGGPFDFVAEVGAVAAFTDDGDPAVDSTRHPPPADTTGLQRTLPIEAVDAGSRGNVAADTVTVTQTGIAADSLTNLEPILGGTDPETDDALRERLLTRFEGKGPGNKRDYELWARAYGGVGRATVVPLWDGPGTVLVIALTEDGDPVSTDTITGLQDFLDPVAGKGHGEAPIGPTVTVTTATEITVDVTATVELEDGYSLDGANNTVAVRESIRAAVREYIESVEPGTEIVRQKVIGRIVAVSGVHDVGSAGGTDLLLNGAATNVALDDDPAEVATLDTLTLTVADV